MYLLYLNSLLIMCMQSCPLCTGPRAYEVTLEVHMTGAGTVAVANKKIITEYTKTLQVPLDVVVWSVV